MARKVLFHFDGCSIEMPCVACRLRERSILDGSDQLLDGETAEVWVSEGLLT